MKSCNYFYKGKLIGDIIALDDFLLTNQKYYADVSDRVFQEAKIDSAKVNRISETLKKAKKENLSKIKAWSEAKKQMINDEELVKLKRPLVGLTEFLSGQVDANGNVMTHNEAGTPVGKNGKEITFKDGGWFGSDKLTDGTTDTYKRYRPDHNYWDGVALPTT